MDEAIRDYARGLAIIAALVLVALAFVANPMPWSPLGQTTNQGQQGGGNGAPSIDLSRFDIPDGWAPGEGTRLVVPTAPGTRT
ncbi:hypothetical protein [Aeromicrobium ginsengisoli]|uniref:Uncharacterized protein n=1 Tax=Aeromicrobium ginsengisoli TaxID=363867 RepID=A0A5M4FAC1_9ACTN|nr:hypothetical protein [Aeromicrobium ginsengisoli]KAA1395284.1 hypothetical protein ESP70_014040 [Aeromicrobium ginsengisoli]